MRRSSTSQTSSQPPRRSSSIDQWSNIGPNSMNRQSMGRASSVGRPSMLKPGNDTKPVNINEIAQQIVQILQNELDYVQPITTKILLLPSTGTFYSLFEYLLTYMGFKEIWNYELMAPHIAQSQGNNANQPLNQPSTQSQPNAVALNKARVELIIFYLTILRYPAVPKPNVLQTMTTPKNWLAMLQILLFLCNDCKFYQTYDSNRLLHLFNKDCEILHEYLKKSYYHLLCDANYLSSERHQKLKSESLAKYNEHLKAGNNIEQLTAEYESNKKQHEFLKSNENELERMLEEEKELMRELAEEENLLKKEQTDYEDFFNNAKLEKKNVVSLKEKLKRDESELAVKDGLYEKQLASGKQLDQLPAKHAQKKQELERTQNELFEAEQLTETLQKKVLSKSQEVKDLISEANSIIKKLKLDSSTIFQDLTDLNLVDFHKKTDLVRPFKDKFNIIRDKYHNEICKLPEKFSQLNEEKKLLENKNEAYKIKIASMENENKRLEALIDDNNKLDAETLESVRLKVKQTKEKLMNEEAELKLHVDKINLARIDYEKLINEQKKIELDIQMQEKTAKDAFVKIELTETKELEEKAREIDSQVTASRAFYRAVYENARKCMQEL